MSHSATVVVPTLLGGERLQRLLDSLRDGPDDQVIVVDNSVNGAAAGIASSFPEVDVIGAERNLGFSRAVNLAAGRAEGDALVLVNDDCVCDPGFVAALASKLDPAGGTVMAAGVMRESGDPGLIDTAGMELDRNLMVLDYMNGEPVARLEDRVPDPIGPSGAAAAFDRAAFVAIGGFDESLFAYWEDVDLVLRLLRAGGHCRLAPDARGTHEHSATLGPGSRRKNYLMGYGRGYVVRKWNVLGARPLRAVIPRELVICAGQAAVDRTLTGITGRVRGYLAARPTEAYPGSLLPTESRAAALRPRARRRARLRRLSLIHS
jgi:N-acetylglucosaminyl-diphospho-decaprenol L-rhamnosyltransferase